MMRYWTAIVPVLLVAVAAAQETKPAVIKSGDVLQVLLIEAATARSVPLIHRLTVDADGRIDIPKLGPIAVAGKTASAMDWPISNSLKKAKLMQTPAVAITVLPDLKDAPAYKPGHVLAVSMVDLDRSYMRVAESATIDDTGVATFKTLGAYPAGGLTQVELEIAIARNVTITFNIKRPKVAITLNPTTQPTP